MKQARSTQPTPRYAIASLSFAVPKPGAAVQILPAGDFRPSDGRALPCGSWKLTPEIAERLVAEANARANKYVIDYEHQTQLADTNGQPAPAAGWFKALEFRPGEGMYAADVAWTARAKSYLEGDEYRYISPVFAFDKVTGEVQKIVSVALTNTPGLDGMDPVALAAMTARFQNAEVATAPPTGSNPSEISMNPILQALLKALGLTDAATEQEAVSAVATLKAQAATVDAQATEITRLKASAPDPAKFVPVDTFNALNAEVVTLKAKEVERDVDALINQAKTEGKVTPAAEPVWREIGKADIARLKSLVASAPSNPALAGQTQTSGKEPAAKDPAKLDDGALAICKAMGITPEQYVAAA